MFRYQTWPSVNSLKRDDPAIAINTINTGALAALRRLCRRNTTIADNSSRPRTKTVQVRQCSVATRPPLLLCRMPPPRSARLHLRPAPSSQLRISIIGTLDELPSHLGDSTTCSEQIPTRQYLRQSWSPTSESRSWTSGPRGCHCCRWCGREGMKGGGEGMESWLVDGMESNRELVVRENNPNWGECQGQIVILVL